MITDRVTGREILVLTNMNENSGCELIFLDFENDTGKVYRAPAGAGSWALNEVPGDRLIVGTFFITLVPFVYMNADHVNMIYLAQVIQGIGSGLAFPTWLGLWSTHLDRKHESFEWSLYSTSVGLGTAFTAVAHGLGLEDQSAAISDRILADLPVDRLLGLADQLGLCTRKQLSQATERFADPAVALESPEARQAVTEWEAEHQILPVLHALEGAVQDLMAFWREGGVPSRSAIRLLAFSAMSPLLPGGESVRMKLATELDGARAEASYVVQLVADVALAGDASKLEGADRVLMQDPLMGPLA